ncbi:MAG: hypothetical protein AAF664_23770 [Planctomycetota bacterium]
MKYLSVSATVKLLSSTVISPLLFFSAAVATEETNSKSAAKADLIDILADGLIAAHSMMIEGNTVSGCDTGEF